MANPPSSLGGRLASDLPADEYSAVRRILAEVAPNEGPPRAVLGAPTWKIRMRWGDPVEPWEMEFALRDILGCRDFGRFEKLAWEYALTFRCVAMTVAFEKFGLRVYVDSDAVAGEQQAENLATDLFRTIGKVIPILKRTIIREIADRQITAGNVRVHNPVPELHSRFRHFVKLSEASRRRAESAEPFVIERTDVEGLAWSSTYHDPSFAIMKESSYEMQAGMETFYSLLEGVLFVEFMLSDRDAADGALLRFIGAGWRQKFTELLDIDSPDIKKRYDSLSEIYRYIRSPSVHGGLCSDGADFDFYLPGIQPVSSTVTAGANSSPFYQWGSLPSRADASAVVLDSYEWVKSGELAAAYTYGDSGLPLFFGSKWRDSLVRCKGDLESLEGEMQKISYFIDQAANMDW